MELEHSFTVPVGVDQAWHTLLDIEQVAPCMPGAALNSVDGDDFTGTVKVRLGPIGLTYKGKASFLEKDEASHKAIIGAQGRDSRGNGTAAATVTATLTEEAATQTRVDVKTDLNITGKPAQFGRGVMADVGNKLIGQFADCLAGKLEGGGAPAEPIEQAVEAAAAEQPADSVVGGVPSAAAPEPTPRSTPPPQSRPAPKPITRTEPEPIDLMASAGPALAKRLAPLAVGLLVLLFILRRRKH